MIIILILIAVLVTCIVLFVTSFLEIQEEDVKYFKDEKGKHLVYGYKIENNKELGLERNTEYWCKKTCKKRIRATECYIDEARTAWPFGVGLVVILALLICGGICLCQNISYGVIAKETEINEHIVELENDQQSLLKFYETGVAKDIDISSSGLPERIKEHNAEVSKLVKDIKINRIDLTNPWLNWFINPAYNKIDLPRVEATYINLN